jgi:hypothetical protein
MTLASEILSALEMADPRLYDGIMSKYCLYPDNDAFDNEDDYDAAVDLAEIKALIACLTEELQANNANS